MNLFKHNRTLAMILASSVLLSNVAPLAMATQGSGEESEIPSIAEGSANQEVDSADSDIGGSSQQEESSDEIPAEDESQEEPEENGTPEAEATPEETPETTPEETPEGTPEETPAVTPEENDTAGATPEEPDDADGPDVSEEGEDLEQNDASLEEEATEETLEPQDEPSTIADKEYDAGDGVVFEYSEKNNQITITGYKGTEKDLQIPDKFEITNEDGTTTTKDVVTIDKGAFKGNLTIESVVIPESVTSVEMASFQGCTSLKTAYVLANITELEDWDWNDWGGGVFEGCTSLETVYLPETLTRIGAFAFKGCNALKSLYIHAGLKEVGDDGVPVGTDMVIYFGGSKSDWESVKFTNLFESSSNYTGLNIVFNYVQQEDDLLFGLSLGKNQFGIRFVDKNKNPMEKVYMTNGEYTTVSNEKGYLSFEDTKPGSTIVATAEGYWSITLDSVPSAQTVTTVVMIPDDEVYMKNVTLSVGSLNQDILSKSFYGTPLEGTATDKATLTANFENKDIESVTLVQGKTRIETNATGEFTFDAVYVDGSLWISDFVADEDVSLIVTQKDGRVTTFPLGLKVGAAVAASVTEQVSLISINEDFKLTVPTSVPVLGGKELEFNLFESTPMQLDILTDGTVYLGLNVGEDDNGSIIWPNVEASYKNALAGTEDISNDFDKKKEFSFGVVEGEVSIMGFGKGSLSANNEVMINIGVIAHASAGASYSQQFAVGFVPVFVSVGVDGSIDAIIYGEMQSVGTSQFDFALSGRLQPEIAVTLRGGVGVDKLLSISASGKGTLAFPYILHENHFQITFGMTGAIEAQALMFKKSLDLTFVEGKVLYDSATNSSRAIDGSDTMTMSEFYESNDYQMMGRDYLYRHTPSSISGDGSTVNSNTFENAMAKVVEVGGKSYMFWIDDAGKQRSAENRTQLFYAVSDGSEWGTKTALYEGDTTADFNFELAVDGDDNIHIVWLKANTSLDGVSDPDDVGGKLDVYYGILNTDADTGEVSEAKNMTETSTPESLPTISADGSIIAWVSMSGYLLNGGKTISYQSTEKDAEAKTVNAEGTVLSLAVGQLDDKDYLAYVVSDNNSVTSLYVRDLESEESVKIDTDTPSRVVFFDGILYWNTETSMESLEILTISIEPEEGGVATETVVYATETILTDETGSSIGDNFAVISDGKDKTAIVWSAMSDKAEHIEAEDATVISDDSSALFTAIYSIEKVGAIGDHPLN